jgi:hypothetical protein
MKQKQPWLGKPSTDILFILLPPFISLLIIMIFPALFQNNEGMPDSWWVVLILLIDVAHVYSTLYRTYFDRSACHKLNRLLLLIPLCSFAGGVLLYSSSALWFWRILAYLAVFHFVRQQYGFMRLYSRREEASRVSVYIDKFTVYYATIYPLLYWHLSGNRNFSWFVKGDFLLFNAQWLLPLASWLYLLMLVLYLAKEIYTVATQKTFNIPKTAVITGTLLSWYFGIIYFNGDLAFTLLNVVSHGIPYMALIWIYGKKQIADNKQPGKLKLFFGQYGILFFLALIFLLAYIEEGLWDWTLWKEHKSIFGIFHTIAVNPGDTLLCFIVPLLTLPQVTHYIIDGFIWKRKQQSATERLL